MYAIRSYYVYYLCDKYGILLLDEANVESHGMGYGKESLAKDPAWEKAHVQRCRSMIQRDKNHPSVILWSHGNEAGNGVNMVAMNNEAHRLDPTRPTHYHFADLPISSDVIGGWKRGNSPIWQGRYLEVFDLYKYEYADDSRPFILNEYVITSYSIHYTKLYEKTKPCTFFLTGIGKVVKAKLHRCLFTPITTAQNCL